MVLGTMLEAGKAHIGTLTDAAKDSYLRPVVILVCGMLLFNLPTALYKTKLSFRAVLYMLFCNDKSWKTPQDPAVLIGPYIKSGGKVEKKTVFFVRHGESTWNSTFNKGNHRSVAVFAIGYIPGLIYSVAYETYLFLSGKMDSWFYDSPLSYLGLSQVDKLAKFFNESKHTEAELISILKADPGAPPSQILCSSLRRALSTMAAGFRDRLARRPDDKILVVPSLQEISRNPDTLSITPAHTLVTASWIDKTSKICDFQHIFTNQTDVSLHMGNKPLDTNGLKRMTEFCEFVFSSSVSEDYVIAGGHSIWFRSFFRTFLPYTVNHVSKKKKITNAGVVAFTLIKAPTPNGVKYMVDPQSIKVVYGGF